MIFSQAEYPEVITKFVNINSGFKQIKNAKIKKSTQVLISKVKQDTLDIILYDVNGNIIREYNLEQDTGAGHKEYSYKNVSFMYDSSGRVLEKTDSSGKNIKKTVLEYEDNGNFSKEEEYINDTLVIKESFDFDDLSRLIECSGKNYSEDCKFVINYQYDSYNNLAKITSRNSCENDQNIPKEISYLNGYDKKSNIISKNTVTPAGLRKTETFKYDSKNRMIQSYESTGKTGYVEIIYSYDSLKNPAKIETSEIFGENIIKFIRSLKYDKFGNLLEVQYLEPNNELINTIKYYYEYYQ